MSDIRMTGVKEGDTLVRDSKLYTFVGWDDSAGGSSWALVRDHETRQIVTLSQREFLDGKFQKV
jgi:hypothetical protein